MKTLLTPLALVAAFASALALPACLGPAGIDRVQFVGDIGQFIEVTDVGRDPSGPTMEAFVELRNMSNKDVRIETRFEWFDGSGQQVSQTTANWRANTLMPNERKQVSATANSPNATDFRVTVREN